VTELARSPLDTAPLSADLCWEAVCRVEALQPERGVAALFGARHGDGGALVGGVQVAVFLTHAGTVHAIGNVDPFSGAAVLSRGIVGDRRGEPTVASPVYKQVFSLVDGRCLDDPAVRVPSYPVRVVDGYLQVGLESSPFDATVPAMRHSSPGEVGG
jgi:nitrite reductase (NADH) small subunit